MATINIDIKNNIASYSINDGDFVVCGNDDHKAIFTFDSEWTSQDINQAKAVFIFGGQREEKKLDSSYSCMVPYIQSAKEIKIGLTLKGKKESTLVTIPLYPCIREEKGFMEDAVYEEYLQDTIDAEKIVEDYVEQIQIAKDLVNNQSVSKIEKRIDGLIARYDDYEFITDTDVYHSKVVPDQVLPWAEVSRIGGQSHVFTSNNLLDLPQKIIKGETGYNFDLFAGTIGGTTAIPQELVSGLPLLEKGNYYFSYDIDTSDSAKDVGLTVVKDDGTVNSSRLTTEGSFVVDKPVRVTVRVYTNQPATISNIILNKGSAPLPYEPYRPSKNLFNIDKVTSMINSTNNTKQEGSINIEDGVKVLVPNTTLYAAGCHWDGYSMYLPVGKYTISAKVLIANDSKNTNSQYKELCAGLIYQGSKSSSYSSYQYFTVSALDTWEKATFSIIIKRAGFYCLRAQAAGNPSYSITAKFKNVQVEHCALATAYEDFHTETLQHTPVEKIISTGRNIWNEQGINGYYDFFTGEYVKGGTHYCSKNKIGVIPNTQYFLSCSSDTVVCFYDSEQNFISHSDYFRNRAFTTPHNCRYITFFTWSDYGSVYKNDIMLNIGSTALPYEPYTETILPVPAEAQGLHGYGMGVNKYFNNFYDCNSKKLRQMVNTYVYNNAEIGMIKETIDNRCKVYCIPNALSGRQAGTPIIVSYPFKKGEEGSVFYGLGGSFACAPNNTQNSTANYLYLDFYNSDLGLEDGEKDHATLVNAVKKLLIRLSNDGTPLTVVYCLQNTTDTPIESQEPKDNFIKINEGGLLIADNEKALAAPITIEYQKRQRVLV